MEILGIILVMSFCLNHAIIDTTILELTKMNTGYILQYSVKIVNSVNKFFINLGEYATLKKTVFPR
jgi:hypothetical protein